MIQCDWCGLISDDGKTCSWCGHVLTGAAASASAAPREVQPLPEATHPRPRLLIPLAIGALIGLVILAATVWVSQRDQPAEVVAAAETVRPTQISRYPAPRRVGGITNLVQGSITPAQSDPEATQAIPDNDEALTEEPEEEFPVDEGEASIRLASAQMSTEVSEDGQASGMGTVVLINDGDFEIVGFRLYLNVDGAAYPLRVLDISGGGARSPDRIAPGQRITVPVAFDAPLPGGGFNAKQVTVEATTAGSPAICTDTIHVLDL